MRDKIGGRTHILQYMLARSIAVCLQPTGDVLLRFLGSSRVENGVITLGWLNARVPSCISHRWESPRPGPSYISAVCVRLHLEAMFWWAGGGVDVVLGWLWGDIFAKIVSVELWIGFSYVYILVETTQLSTNLSLEILLECKHTNFDLHLM